MPPSCTAFFSVENYALGETLTSGQAFRWGQVGSGWESVIGNRWVRLRESSIGIEAETIDLTDDWSWLADYLQVRIDLQAIIDSFPADPHLARAVEQCRGLRLLRQDPWECLASFILSSTKQIVQIQQIIELICQRFGQPVAVPPGRGPVWAFPSAATLAALSEADLRGCKMGFRAPYLRSTAACVAAGEVDLTALARMDVQSARKVLMGLPGVGRKIADCVLLFAYGFQQAFPVDVWVLKALRKLYFPRRRPTAKRLLHFTETHFGPNAGYAQQYLFHYMRTRIGRGKL